MTLKCLMWSQIYIVKFLTCNQSNLNTETLTNLNWHLNIDEALHSHVNTDVNPLLSQQSGN